MATVNRTIGADPNMVYESNNTSNKTQGTSQRLKQFQEEEKQIRRLREETYKQDRINEQKLFQYRIANEKEIIKLRQGADSEAYKAAQKLYNTQLKNLLDLNKRKKKSEDETQKAMENMLSETEKKTESISRGFSSMIDSAVKTLNKAYGSFSLSGATDNVANQIAEFRKEFSSYAVNNMDLNSMKDVFSTAIGNINSQLGTSYTATDAMNAVRGLAGTASGLSSLRGMTPQQLQQLIEMNLTGQLTGSNALTQQTATFLRMGDYGTNLFQRTAGSIAYQQLVNPYFDMSAANRALNDTTIMRNFITRKDSPEQFFSGLSESSVQGQGNEFVDLSGGYIGERVENGSGSIYDQLILPGTNVLNPESMTGHERASALKGAALLSRDVAGGSSITAGLLGLREPVAAADIYSNTVGAEGYIRSITDYQGKSLQALQELGEAQANSYTKSEQTQRNVENLMFDVLPIQSDELEISTMILSGVNEIVKLLNIKSITDAVSGGARFALENALGGSGSRLLNSWFGKAIKGVGASSSLMTAILPGLALDVALGVGLYKAKEERDRRVEQQSNSAVSQGYDKNKSGYDAIVNGNVTSKFNQEIIHGVRSDRSQEFINNLTPEQMQYYADHPQAYTNSSVYKGADQSLADLQAEQKANSGSFSDALNSVASILQAVASGQGNATGIYNVDNDGYLAKLHKGEMVLPGPQANYVRSMFGLETKPISGVYSDPGYRSNVMGIPEYASGTDEKVASSSIDDYVAGGAKRDSVNSLLLGRLVAFAKSQGKKITVVSGYRTAAHQAQLYKNAKNKKYVAKAGNSMHMSGLAADIDNASSSAPDSVSWFRSMPDDSKLYPFKLWRPLLHSKTAREAWHVEAFETGYPNMRNKSEEYTAAYLEKKYGKGNGSATEYSSGSITMDEASDNTTDPRETGQGGMFDYLQEYSSDPTVANLLAMYGGNYSSGDTSGSQGSGSSVSFATNGLAGVAARAISRSEGNYGSINPNDNGSLSIGIFQWHGTRAGDLLKRMYDSNPQGFTSNANNLGIGYVVGKLNDTDYWRTKKISSGEKSAWSSLISQYTGIQDQVMAESLQSYIDHATKNGASTDAAKVLFANFENKFGSGGINSKFPKGNTWTWKNMLPVLSSKSYQGRIQNTEAALQEAGIPLLADGGIITSPTLAMIGEGKPGQSRQNEAVIPLDDSGTALSDTLGLTDFQDVFTSTMSFNLNSLLAKMDQIIASVIMLQNAVSSQSQPMDLRNNSLASFNYR